MLSKWEEEIEGEGTESLKKTVVASALGHKINAIIEFVHCYPRRTTLRS